ncbi:MAG: DUF2569 domain-containing protein [Pyrinomonadaceae bacterium MAG19_C2-C3]|nr:DUF2569 domain-containing protein [Pyrinomonadaceae bacterium MAG19_C2-C3]
MSDELKLGTWKEDNVEQENTSEGIGGWLILVAIGVVISPLRLLAFTVGTYPEIFSSGAWQILTTPSSEAYNPMWAPFLVGEILINTGLILASLYMAYLFFSKKTNFPKWYIGIACFSLVFVIIDAFAMKLVMPDEPIFDSDTIKELLRSLFAVIIWVPYMLVSKRVKATFVS